MLLPLIMFWLSAIVAALSTMLMVVYIRRRWWQRVVLNLVLTGVNVWLCLLWWSIHGACLLPHRAVVEFSSGMTLCPGQSAIIRLEIPPQSAGRNS